MTHEYRSGDGDWIAANIIDDVGRTRKRAARVGELSEVLHDVRGAASSRQRDVTVEVDPAGRVTRLHISNQACARGGSRLATELMTLFSSAYAEAQRRVGEAAIAVLDAGDPAVPLFESVASAVAASNAESASQESGAGEQTQNLRRTGDLW